jgi:hypothetical protein
MLNRLLQLDADGPPGALQVFLRHPWAGVAVLLLLAAAAGYALLLYRKETTLTRGRRSLLGVLRALVLAGVVLLLFEPVLGFETILKLPRTVLVLLDVSESMGLKDARTNEDEVRSAALALGRASFKNPGLPLSETARSAVTAATRLDLAKAILAHPETNVFEHLGRTCKVRYFAFGDRLDPAAGEGEVLPAALRAAGARAPATRLGSALEEAVTRYSGQSIAGIVVLTDGAVNAGLEPLAVAQRFQDRGIPICPVGIGLPGPLDVRLERLLVPDTVFHQDIVPVRVQLGSRGFVNRTVNLTATLNGRKVAGKVVRLTGRPQFEELTFTPDQESGTANLEMSITPLPEEATGANNRLTKNLRILGDKIKVLYVEGKPRWEYRYLRRVLLRDHRLEVKFLLTEGDRDLAAASDEYLDDFPEAAARAFHFDLVILGDVPASYFSPVQLQRLEELVRERGGSCLMLAGRRHAPGSYAGTPLEALLPVKLRGAAYRDVDDELHPVVTAAGAEHPVTALDASREVSQERWGLVRPLHRLAQLDGPKPAATVLAELSADAGRRDSYPLIAWQRYGSGKALFVGTDQLWRLRFKEGDKYHARFWGQAIQFLTLSRLLGENQRIRLETDRREYRTGERIQLTANVLNESFEPVKTAQFTALVERLKPDREPIPVRLEPVPNMAGLYQGAFVAEKAGDYRLTVPEADRPLANQADFQVESAPLELLEPAMQEDLLRKLAEVSGGHYFALQEFPALVQKIAGEERVTVVRREKDLWDVPAVLVALLGLLGAEWLLRRKYDLI